VVLYELFTGKNPFLKDNVSLTLNEIMSYDESALPAALTGVPEKIRNVILKLLKKIQLKDTLLLPRCSELSIFNPISQRS
jgi:hypothetical protein